MRKFTATESLECQEELIRFWSSDVGREFWRGWYQRREADNYPLQSTKGSSDERVNREIAVLMTADTYFISAEMTMLALHAARTMPDQNVIKTDLPSPAGFMVFEVPLVFPDIRGVPCSLAAMSWMCAHLNLEDGKEVFKTGVPAISITEYSDWFDERDEYLNSLRAGDDLKNFTFPTRLVLLSETCLMIGQPPMDIKRVAEKRGCSEDIVHENAIIAERFPIALWALLNQRLPTVTDVAPERHARKRLARAQSVLATKRIRVVTLRLPENRRVEISAPQHVEWSHRWIVSGHWRNAWYPSLNEHRLQWIWPYQKGPEDKPLVVKQTVRQLVR